MSKKSKVTKIGVKKGPPKIVPKSLVKIGLVTAEILASVAVTAWHMGSFPQPQQFFAAAQENKDFGALHRGPSMP